jgi:hypothetical protein
MELRVFNNQMGSFNILNPSQKSFEFSMGLCEDGIYKAIEVNGVRAVISFSGDEDDKADFEDPIENLGDVFTKCFQYSDKVWSTVNYKEQCLLFAKLYQENVDAMDAVMVEKHKVKTQKKIDELQKELNWNTILYDLADDINGAIQEKINKVKKSVAFKENELSELKEDSESYAKSKKTLDGYIAEIEKLQSHLIAETV